jgi:predicted HicB family RNase H-like nuclease
MSKPTSPQKKGRPAKKIVKRAQNICLTPAITAKAKKTAFQAGLSLSTWIEQLIREKLTAAEQ